MTGAASEVAAAMLRCYPVNDGTRTALDQASARSQWGVCLGAVAEALIRSGELPEPLRFAFYRAAGLVID